MIVDCCLLVVGVVRVFNVVCRSLVAVRCVLLCVVCCLLCVARCLVCVMCWLKCAG